MSLHKIGVLFPLSWQYGPLEHKVWKSTAGQIEKHFPGQRNLLINTTWFGPQFRNTAWSEVMHLFDQGLRFDNLFLLATIDPVYVSEDQIQLIMSRSGAAQQYRIGMWEDSPYEWNWHAGAGLKSVTYTTQELEMTSPDHVFLCYQRKPRRHRIELTNLLLESGLDKFGIVTLGGGNPKDHDNWSEGLQGPAITVGDDLSQWSYDDIGHSDFCAGLPNDVFGIGQLSLWQKHFLNVVSETEFNEWHPRFVTEKTWKPIFALRPFLLHGQIRIYQWLRQKGFRTFNHYWPQIDIESNPDQHGSVMAVLHWLCDMDKTDLKQMYQDMLPNLYHNRARFIEFNLEQNKKMHQVFDA